MSKIAKRMAELESPDPQVRMNAASWLGEIHEIRAVPQITAALKDSDWQVRVKAAEALGKIGHDAAIPALFSACEESGINVATEIAFALVAIAKADPRMIDQRVHAIAQHGLGSHDPKRKAHGAWVLKRIEHPACVPYLIVGLWEDSKDIRMNCTAGLVALASRATIDMEAVADSLAKHRGLAAMNGDGDAMAAESKEIFNRIKAAVDAREARQSGMLSAGTPRPPAGKTVRACRGRTAI